MASESIGNAYLNVIPKLSSDGVSSIANQATSGLSSSALSAGEGFGANLLAGIKGPLVGAGAAIAGAMGVSAIAGSLMGIGETFDTMKDTIITGTGASGEALEALADSAKAIATTVPTSFENAGDIVQNLNTRMGLVGDELEAVGQRVAAAGELLGSSVNLDSLTGAMNAFGVANEDVAEKMDYLFNVGQATGIGFDELTSIIEKNAPALQNLGFSFEETANMAGLLDKAGMDAQGVMSKMSKALVELAEPGQSAADAYQEVIDKMQGFIEEGNTASALDIASTVFGTRGAAQFVGALQSGAISMDELKNAALGAGDGIMGTIERTMDWNERLDLLKNKITEALEPLGGAIFDGANAAIAGLTTAFDTFQAIFTGVTEAVAPAMEELSAAFTLVGESITQVFDGASEAIGGSFSLSLEDVIATVSGALIPVIQALATFLAESVVPAISSVGEWINTALIPAVSKMWEWFNAYILPVLIEVAGFVMNNLVPALQGIASIVLNNVVPAILTVAQYVVNNAIPVFQSLADWVGNYVVPVFQSLGDVVLTVSGWISDMASMVSGAIGSVGSFLGSISLPSFSFHAAGGWVDSPTAIDIAGERGGEFVWPSYGPYLDKYADALSSRMGGTGVTITGNQFTVREEADIERIGRELVSQWQRRQQVLTWA